MKISLFKSFIVFALVLLLLNACAVKSFKTSGQSEIGSPLEKMSVSFSPTLPKQIKIIASGRGYFGQITESDKLKARTESIKLAALFFQSFKNDFKNQAEPYGLTIVEKSDAVPAMAISITAMQMGCNTAGCISNIDLSGVLPPFGGRTQPWTFTSTVGQSSTLNSDIDSVLFNEFSRHLLESMLKEGILKKQ